MSPIHAVKWRLLRWRRMRVLRQEFAAFQALSERSERSEPRFALNWSERRPCLEDKTADTPYDQHYVLHTAWAARTLAQIKPRLHIDISSNLYFNVACSAFVPIKFYDYRPALLKLDNLECDRADLMALPFADASVESLSCLHVIEHIGLGRYGDPLDAEGDIKAMRELARVLRVGGHLMFVTPVGQPRIEYNAHRIYSYEQVIGHFPGLTLRDFALIPDVNTGGFVREGAAAMVSAQKYACGCFWFERRA